MNQKPSKFYELLTKFLLWTIPNPVLSLLMRELTNRWVQDFEKNLSLIGLKELETLEKADAYEAEQCECDIQANPLRKCGHCSCLPENRNK
jgi:hypothetical protein